MTKKRCNEFVNIIFGGAFNISGNYLAINKTNDAFNALKAHIHTLEFRKKDTNFQL